MSWTLRWIFMLVPCVPGLTLLLAALFVARASVASVHFGPEDGARAQANLERSRQLLAAGSVVFVAGVGMGAFVAWRIAHPQPDADEEEVGGNRPQD